MSTHDKRELLKLKQGLIEDSDIIATEKVQAEPERLHGKKWLENFIYHHKVAIIAALFIAIMATFFIVESVNKRRPDLEYLFVVSTEEANAFLHDYNYAVGESLELFCPDFDDSGYTYAMSYPVNLFDTTRGDAVISNQAKLFGEIQIGTTRLILADKGSFEIIIGTENNIDDVFVNLSALYPYNENIEDNVFFKARGSSLEAAAGIIFPDDMYLAVLGINLSKDKQLRAHEHTMTVLDNIINGEIINTGNDY